MVFQHCPYCGGYAISDKYIVDWNEEKKEFTVCITLYCRECSHHWDEKLLSSLPLEIARTGNCSCGGQLSLGSFSVERKVDEIEFRGKYYCEHCKTEMTTHVNKLESAIVGIWPKSKSVVVGHDGLHLGFDAGGIFISHATDDRELIECQLVELFRVHGIRTWYCKEDVCISDFFERKIIEGLNSCRWFLLAMSPHSAASEWVRDELHWALEKRPNNILPVMLIECDPSAFHVRLARMHCPRFYEYPEAVKGQLVERILGRRGDPKTVST